MASVGENIMQLIASVLNDPANDPPRLTVRQRTEPLAVEHPDGAPGLDEILLYAVKETSERIARNSVKHERQIRFELVVAGQPPLDSVVDPLYLYIVQTLFSSAELMQSISLLEETGLLWETEASFVDACICALEMKVTYITTLDPAQAAMQTSGT